MNKNIIIIIIVAIVILAGGAYWLSNGNTAENSAVGSHTEPAIVIARKDLAGKLGVDEKSVTIVQVTEETWNDSCLGLGGPAESCVQALTPGFKVEMQAGGKTYTYRTDKTGSVIRAEVQP